MSGQRGSSLALFVTGRPYHNRVARADIDIALAAAALDFNLQIYFSGAAIMQLAAERNSADAQLPGGYRAWAALPDLAEAAIYVEQEWLEFCSARGIELVLPVGALSPAAMQRAWRGCDHALVL